MKPKKAELYTFEMKVNQKFTDDFYSEEHIYADCEDDLINVAEEGFMLGYMNS